LDEKRRFAWKAGAQTARCTLDSPPGRLKQSGVAGPRASLKWRLEMGRSIGVLSGLSLAAVLAVVAPNGAFVAPGGGYERPA
jgi:hypothetical protein